MHKPVSGPQWVLAFRKRLSLTIINSHLNWSCLRFYKSVTCQEELGGKKCARNISITHAAWCWQFSRYCLCEIERSQGHISFPLIKAGSWLKGPDGSFLRSLVTGDRNITRTKTYLGNAPLFILFIPQWRIVPPYNLLTGTLLKVSHGEATCWFYNDLQ